VLPISADLTDLLRHVAGTLAQSDPRRSSPLENGP
jgi:hypothetical protein